MHIIVLEHPRIRSEKRFNDIANTPLWSCLMGGYAAAALSKAGHEVIFLDAATNFWSFEATAQEIIRLSPSMLAVNAVYFWEHTDKFFGFLGNLRRAGFDGHINLFGFFPTLACHAILKQTTEVDSIVVGECESALCELAKKIEAGDAWQTISGVASRTSSGIHFSNRAPEPDPDIFAFPFRDTAPGNTVSILGSRGCYNHCSFCPVPSYYNNGPLWRGRSIHNILLEMNELLERDFRDFYFVDPNFIGPGKKGYLRTIELLTKLTPLGITFGMETRPNDLDERLMDLLASAGLQTLLMGIESGSPDVLDRLQKRASEETAVRAINLCRSVGIEPEIGFLMFVPDSTLGDLIYNLTFLRSNNLLDRLDRTANLLCHNQIVLMGTRDYSHFQQQGRLVATGPLGFEGEISFKDDRVKWVSDLTTYACLTVLKEMSSDQSPVYWQIIRDNPAAQRLNVYLVDLFCELLQEAQKNKNLPSVESFRTSINRDLLSYLGRFTLSMKNSRHC